MEMLHRDFAIFRAACHHASCIGPCALRAGHVGRDRAGRHERLVRSARTAYAVVMSEAFPEPLPHLEIALRMLTALACGIVIGLNRDLHGKPAGARTFGLVSVGSAVVVIVILQASDTGSDALSRVMQGVVTGIGFLGAGVIFQRNSPTEVYGLTTAAAVWLTAGLGMAAGAGQYAIAGFGLVVAMLLLLTGGRLEDLTGRLLGRYSKRNTEDTTAEREARDD